MILRRKNDFIVVLFLIMLMCVSCATSQRVTAKHDTLRISNIDVIHDTIFRDRSHIERVIGDTVYISDTVIVDKIRYYSSVDTVYRVVSDTVQLTKTTKSPVKRSFNFIFYAVILMVFVFVGFVIYMIYKRFH